MYIYSHGKGGCGNVQKKQVNNSLIISLIMKPRRLSNSPLREHCENIVLDPRSSVRAQLVSGHHAAGHFSPYLAMFSFAAAIYLAAASAWLKPMKKG